MHCAAALPCVSVHHKARLVTIKMNRVIIIIMTITGSSLERATYNVNVINNSNNDNRLITQKGHV